MRYLLELSYVGTNYHGWQIQPNANTVQGEVNKALSTILREEILTLGSGRTDAGVHGEQQFAHFDSEKELDESLLSKLNGLAPVDIAFHSIRKVDDDFNARFAAESRAYRYRIELSKNAFKKKLYYRFHKPLDIEAMNSAVALLFDFVDFECFSKVHTEVNNFNCTIMEAKWTRKSEREIEFYIKANRFLRGMVRAIVGTLLDVGLGKLSLEDFKQIIESKDRNKASWSAPAEGLFLVEVNYPFDEE